mmetsp:Transcript_21193/g.44752  ORF Transcript_21193/g.44752 Transcript_21193/m.44752 type:complete len:716 (+) Transcript_21193:87-2234(+)
MSFKERRRRISSLARTAAVIAAASLASAATVDEKSTSSLVELHHHQEHHESDVTVANVDESHHENEHFHRRLSQSAAAAFKSWTPHKVQHAIPLDLAIDPSNGQAYVKGLNGFMEPYAEVFAPGHSSERSYWESILELENIAEGEDFHRQEAHVSPRDRLYYKILEEDGIKTGMQKNGLRGRTGTGRRLLEEEEQEEAAIMVAVHLDSLEFSLVSESEMESDADEVYGLQEYAQVDEDHEATLLLNKERQRQRSLQGGLPQDYAPSRMNPNGNNNNRKNNNNNNNKRKNDVDNTNNHKKNNKTKKKKLPKIDRLNPSQGATVQSKQTFSARIQPSQVTESDISEVNFQLEDHQGATSSWLSVPKISGDIYEITVEGFHRYPGTQWKYTMQAQDRRGKKKVVNNIAFNVEGTGGSSGNFADIERAPQASGPMPQNHESDSNWPHGGAIQSSTGRIMFEFDDGTDESFVCSGTVVMDGQHGESPDANNGRTIIQTAAHCAYNDVLKKFASKAIFVPDQSSTRADKSNFDCDDDYYGCWYLSFATIASGWADGTFPDNVPYDYAFYTVFDHRSTHEGGWKNGLTGTLDRDVIPMAIDFDMRPDDKFVFSIGYSADKDPQLRHCAMTNTNINGVPWFTNLWLEDCGLTGGASGGPWIHNMDTNGIGTLISNNSWGFTNKVGMAGPPLRTSGGSLAECLYEKAKSANDPGKDGGIIVRNC